MKHTRLIFGIYIPVPSNADLCGKSQCLPVLLLLLAQAFLHTKGFVGRLSVVRVNGYIVSCYHENFGGATVNVQLKRAWYKGDHVWFHPSMQFKARQLEAETKHQNNKSNRTIQYTQIMAYTQKRNTHLYANHASIHRMYTHRHFSKHKIIQLHTRSQHDSNTDIASVCDTGA